MSIATFSVWAKPETERMTALYCIARDGKPICHDLPLDKAVACLRETMEEMSQETPPVKLRVPSDTYWNGRGRYQAAYAALINLLPASGECEDPKGTNKALDRFRRANNCYYDLFNNGLCNRGKEFRTLFRVGPLPRKARRLDFAKIDADGKVEAAMDRFILAAAQEQGISVS